MGTPSVPNGIVFQQNVTKVFHLTCLDGYHSTQGDEIRCLPSCNWTFAECNPVDCGLPPSLANGMMALRNNSTTFTSQAEVSCNPGYFLNGSYSIIHCTTQGRWTQDSFKCLPVECPVLDPYDKLTIELDPYTTKSIVNTTAMFSCPPSSILVCYKRIKCTINGQWTGPVPKCIMLEKTVRNCQVDVDTKDRTWRETQPGTIVVENCPNGYSGKVSRQCSEEGLWLNPFYNCVSERVAELMSAATLGRLVGNVARRDSGSTHSTTAYQNALLNYYMRWKSTAYLGAMKVLNVVDKYADILMNTLANNSESSKTIQMDNMVVHVSMVNTTSDDLKFPHKPLGITSSVILPKASLKGSNSIAAVVYRNLTGIIDSTINSEVVTVTLDNWKNTTNFVVDITMDYAQNLHATPFCSFWNTTFFAWDTTGCLVMSSNHSSATCRCTHLTNFAILMSPFIQVCKQTTCCCLVEPVRGPHNFLRYVYWWHRQNGKQGKAESFSLAIVIICTTLASFLHYIYLVVFSLMLVEGIDVAVSILIVFQTKSKLKWMLSAAWVVPAVIVGITLAVTKTEGYGNEKSCWLTIKRGVFWAFVGPALLVVLVNFIILVIVIRATLRSYTMAKKSTVERSKSAVWCLSALLPLTGLTWVLGVLYLDESMVWVQYVFAVCNSLQGLADKEERVDGICMHLEFIANEEKLRSNDAEETANTDIHDASMAPMLKSPRTGNDKSTNKNQNTSDATEIRVGTLAIKKIEWTIDAKSLPKQKSSKDSQAAIYID
ncbi:hypothetical protein DPMN_103837 [Dreissena polymorpha]|uniref:Uncharacterized protein n=1 Tax=Dreissena polymorpha TaxID=45954 RepID=A0A9D4H983_DREPO|nr:hypothetical protein DPMN_103837 [Dreissena polymorpha]